MSVFAVKFLILEEIIIRKIEQVSILIHILKSRISILSPHEVESISKMPKYANETRRFSASLAHQKHMSVLDCIPPVFS